MLPSEVTDIADLIFPKWREAEEEVQRDILASAWKIHNAEKARAQKADEDWRRLIAKDAKRPADQEGWKLVPVEPTEEMYQAALQSGFEGSLDNFSADFKSACSAAPTPEAK